MQSGVLLSSQCLLSAGVNAYTNAGTNTTMAYAASNTATPSSPAAQAAATATTASSSQSTVESGQGGPDYAGAYEHSFDSADVTATPSAGTEATPTSTTTATAAAVTASAASLNPAVVYATAANATARSFATGSGSYVEVCLLHCCSCLLPVLCLVQLETAFGLP